MAANVQPRARSPLVQERLRRRHSNRRRQGSFELLSLKTDGGTKIGLIRTIWLVLAGFAITAEAAANDSSRDYRAKSRFLINFAQFTEWPTAAFPDEKTPLIIGLLGTDPFGQDLDKLLENELVRGHRLHVLRYRRVEEIKSCHILYIAGSEESRLDDIVRSLREKPVLTVSEIENSVMRGVIIRMKTENKKVRLAINLESAKAANLVLRSKLLRLGQIVQPTKK
jgi:YfiR/HmsC-like